MSQIQTFILNKLKTDPNLVPSPFVDVVNRWPKPGGPNIMGATPQFYETDGRPRQALWVEDMGKFDAPFAEGFGGKRARPNVIAIVYARSDGQAAADLVETRLMTHFRKSFYQIVPGSVWEFKQADRLPQEEGGEYGYNGMLIVRFMIEVVGHEPLLVL